MPRVEVFPRAALSYRRPGPLAITSQISSLLMQHAVGPQWGGMPLLALAGYALAIRFTFSIARGRALR